MPKSDARTASLRRGTAETEVTVGLALDGTGAGAVATGIGFLDHMLKLLAFHALFDLRLSARGDLKVDAHHTTEDIAVALGAALSQALGSREGLRRFGAGIVPLDEALATVAVDAGGRSFCQSHLPFAAEPIGGLEGSMLAHFFDAFARAGGLSLNLQASGAVGHHVAEATFKALGLALRTACERDPRRAGVASTKGAVTRR